MPDMPLKIVFAGTPLIAKSILAKILAGGFAVDLVLTKPDRPRGRGNKITQSVVKEFAIANNINVLQPLSFKTDVDVLTQIQLLKPDIIIVVAYGLIFPKELLAIPRLGCINIHVSLLPRHRGAAPIARAILAGDKVSGVTIMQMDSGLDTGNMLLQEEVTITPTDTAGSLEDKLTVLGADMIIKYLNNYATINPLPQSDVGITYAGKIEKPEAVIDWTENATIIERKIRGYNPAPGCFSYLDGVLFKIWQAQAYPQSSKKDVPGVIIGAAKNGIAVACGDNTAIIINELQAAGKTRQLAKDYILGHQDIIGKVFKGG